MNKEMRVLSLADDANVYIGIPKGQMSNSLELLIKCEKAAEYKINMEKFNIYPGSKDEQTEPKILVVTFILSPQMRYVDTRHKKNVHILQRECCKPDERSQRNKLITTYSNFTGKKKDGIYCQDNDSNQLAIISTGEI